MAEPYDLTYLQDQSHSIRLKSILTLRWLATFGQIAAIAVVAWILRFDLPILAMAPLVGVSLASNAYLQWRSAQPRLRESELVFYLLFDTAQLTAMLYLSGGLQNPFAAMILIYVTVAAAVLSPRGVVAVCVFAFFSLTLLAFSHDPLPWRGGGLLLDRLYSCGVWASLMIAAAFISICVGRLVRDVRQMSRALTATQQALAQEQRLSAVGSLAAATAHQLGTPLNTITLIAHDFLDQFPPGHALRADVEMLCQQSRHCKDVLGDLGRNAKIMASPAMTAPHLPLHALVNMVVDDHKLQRPGIHIDMHSTESADNDLVVLLRPELLHGLGNIVQNAIQHAAHNVVIEWECDGEYLRLLISDDGAGFPPELIPALGEPYVQRMARRDGMGLGIFIAKTLFEKMHGDIIFSNATDGGAEVSIRLPLSSIVPAQPQKIFKSSDIAA